MKLYSFEELAVYKKAREFRKKVYTIIKRLPSEEKYNLQSQLRRAALSVTNNIAEGFGRFHFQENIQFCRQSRGSLTEIFDDLNTCLDEKYLSAEEVGILKKEGEELLKVLNGYIAYLKRSKST